MENILNFLKKMKVDKRLCGLLLALLIVAGCSEKEDNPIPATEGLNTTFSDASARLLDLPEELQLEGVTTFYIYAEKEKLEIANASSLCLATLTHVEDQQYTLETEEFMPGATDPFRTLTWEVKMTPSGVLDFVWPDANDIALLEMLTGYSLRGPGANTGSEEYHGKFDGARLLASTHLIGQQLQLGLIPPFSDRMVEGPIMLEFGIDLTVVDN